MDLEWEIKILKDNIADLQRQLGQAHIRISELMKEKSSSNEEVIKQKQFIQEITGEIKRVNSETEQKIQQQMDSIPDVTDSKTFLKE